MGVMMFKPRRSKDLWQKIFPGFFALASLVSEPGPGFAQTVQTIYPNDDVFVEGNVNDPNATSWTTYDGWSASPQSQIVYGLSAANGVGAGRHRQ
jgi:hypothetical protein